MSSENESVSPPLNVEKCSLVLVDVAGTTTSIDFVKNTLFPFVIERAEAFLTSKWDEDSVKNCIKEIQENDQELDVAKAVEIVKKLTEENSPNNGLKTLQGLIYKEGYEKGDLKAHIFEDVAEAFEMWAKSRQIAVYSTGSVDSQKLLFAHTISGDLSGHITKYFDQTVGKKTEAESYKKIAEETKFSPEEIVFITDDITEATAAKAGGLHAVLIKRDDKTEHSEEVMKDFVIVSSFSELTLDKTSKRKMDEDPVNKEAPPSKVPKTDSETTNGNTTEKVEQEPMEVDSQIKETETIPEETENLVKDAPEKTDPEEKKDTTDADMKEIENEKIEPEASVKPAVEVTVEEVQQSPVEKLPSVVEEVKPESEVEVTKEVVSETAKEKEGETSAKSDSAEQETVGDTNTKSEEIVNKEEPQPEKTDKTEEKPSTDSPVEQSTEVAKEVIEAEKKPEESKPEAEMEEANSEKPKTEEKPVVEEEAAKNGEEGETSTPKTEEKENKSVLANGVENGNKDESEVDNATDGKESETTEVTKEDHVDNKDDDNEVKVKKLEESAESKTVSVEV